MFEKITNTARWKRILMDSTIPIVMKRAIEESLIPHNISVEKYSINEECIVDCKPITTGGKRATLSVIETINDITYKYSCINNSNMPLWYYIAYPDVFLWTISDNGGKHFKEVIEPKFNNQNILDARGEVKIEVVNFFIDEYIRVTRKKLECSI